MLVNIINYYKLNFIIPISMVDENMARAHKRNGLLEQKFWFNKNFAAKDYETSQQLQTDFLKSYAEGEEPLKPEYEEFYIHEILNGKPGSDFKGVLFYIEKFMQMKHYSTKQTEQIQYLFSFL